ncbi:hypothetical protein AB1N83_000682 [Pleurotus pulmonarius]
MPTYLLGQRTSGGISGLLLSDRLSELDTLLIAVIVPLVNETYGGKIHSAAVFDALDFLARRNTEPFNQGISCAVGFDHLHQNGPEEKPREPDSKRPVGTTTRRSSSSSGLGWPYSLASLLC